MSDPFMVKVQRSITTSESTPQMLIYDRDRNVNYQSELDPEIAKMMRKRLKVYMWAVLHDDGIIELQGKPYKNEAEGESNFEQFSFSVMNVGAK